MKICKYSFQATEIHITMEYEMLAGIWGCACVAVKLIAKLSTKEQVYLTLRTARDNLFLMTTHYGYDPEQVKVWSNI